MTSCSSKQCLLKFGKSQCAFFLSHLIMIERPSKLIFPRPQKSLERPWAYRFDKRSLPVAFRFCFRHTRKMSWPTPWFVHVTVTCRNTSFPLAVHERTRSPPLYDFREPCNGHAETTVKDVLPRRSCGSHGRCAVSTESRKVGLTFREALHKITFYFSILIFCLPSQNSTHKKKIPDVL